MQISVKVRPTEWLGRTLYRVYYLQANGRWARLARYEAPTAEQVKQQVISNHRGSATLVWKD